MRDKALAVDCPAREPDPVLLEQLTALAAASVVPTAKPWWHRLTIKTGAAAVAGVLLISGATADAEHGSPTPAPIAVDIVGSTPQVTPPHHKALVQEAAAQASAPASPVVSPRTLRSIRHAGKRAQLQQRQRAHSRKHRAGSGDGGGSSSGNGSVGVQLARLAMPQASALAAPASAPAPAGHPRGHAHQHAHTQH